MKRMWCDPLSSYEGEFWTLPPSRAYPKPVQQPYPPIHIGGETDIALRRVVRLQADWLPFNMTPETLVERRARLGEMLEGSGRSLSDVYITVSPNREVARPEFAQAFAEAGADQLIVHMRRSVTVDNVAEALDEMATAYGLAAPG